MNANAKGVIGQSVQRIEDRPLILGKGMFAGDISFAHQLHMRVVRSTSAHGTVKRIDASAARALPGVHAVWTAADIPEIGPIDFREGKIEKLEPYRQPVLANGRVRYVGEPVAAVFATDAYTAEDAADLVEVEIEDLPVIMDARSTPGEFAPGLSTEAAIITQGFGDTASAFASAHAIVEIEVSVGRHSGVPLETRGAIGRYDAARDVLELHGAAKVPHKNKETLARLFGRPASALHLFEYHVGGGFGVRGEIYPEDILVLAAALRFGGAVKWIEDRREHLMAANQSREQHHKVRAAVDEKGALLAIENEFWHDQGAYPRTHAMRVAETTCGILPAPIASARTRPSVTIRSPTRRLRPPIARRAAMKRISCASACSTPSPRVSTFRASTCARKTSFARTRCHTREPLEVLEDDVSYDSGDYSGLLDKSLKAIRWDDLQGELAARRAKGELVGVGVAAFVEKSGLGPSDGAHVCVDTNRRRRSHHRRRVGWPGLRDRHGAGLRRGAWNRLSENSRRAWPHRSHRLRHRAHASRATVMTANAVHAAALKVREKALSFAAEMLQSDAAILDIVDGRVVRRGEPDGPSISLGEIANHLRPAAKLRRGREPGLSSDGWFDTDHQVYPYGNQIAVVALDRENGRRQRRAICYRL